MKKFLKKFFGDLLMIAGNDGGFWHLLAGAGLGLLKNELVDKPQHQRMQKAEAAKTEFSPWTGMQGKTLTPPSAFGSMLQGATTAGMLGQAGAFKGLGGGGAAAGAQAAAPAATGIAPVGATQFGADPTQSMYGKMGGIGRAVNTPGYF